MRNRASNSDKETVKPPRKGVIEEHYLVDTIKLPKSSKERKIVLPGVPSYENDFARDTHDFFNLVALVSFVFIVLVGYFVTCTFVVVKISFFGCPLPPISGFLDCSLFQLLVILAAVILKIHEIVV